ncbi:MAG TPA: 4Fe-4S dicluster domain-containing protein [Acidobacteriota bacterium]|nr:4Fe-4S dicluster domain-containing protein [Acidobacteriota bacterium]
MKDSVQENGVVGAGGAGFPTYLKLRSRAETVIVNGAECEPLLHKDKELLLHHFSEVIRGLTISMERVGAHRGVIAVKDKFQAAMQLIAASLPQGVEIQWLTDTYPAGDEFILVYDVTGRIIPPGGLPLDVGSVVHNVETLVNLASEKPVTRKYLTVAGAVNRPVTLQVPVGMSIGEVIQAAGGSTEIQFDVLVGGVMMGRLAGSLNEPVTKTTGGLIVLPRNHRLIERYRLDWHQINKIGKSACDQCGFCTELCPRFLIGHPIEPHKAMRALGFRQESDVLVIGTLACCECNLCSLYSCPEDLDPRNVCVHDKSMLKEKGMRWTGDAESILPHGMFQYRRVPIRRLKLKLGLDGFNDTGPLVEEAPRTGRVSLPLQQHLGTPCTPAVRVGDRVRVGDIVASPPDGKPGCNIHASIDGTVRSTDGTVVIEA